MKKINNLEHLNSKIFRFVKKEIKETNNNLIEKFYYEKEYINELNNNKELLNLKNKIYNDFYKKVEI